MTNPEDDHPLRTSQYEDTESSIAYPKTRKPEGRASPFSSIASLPYRRSNASLSSLFASTSSSPTRGSSSGTVTPSLGTGSTLPSSPGGSTLAASPLSGRQIQADDPRNIILRSFVPHISVHASADTEEIARQKGFLGGFLELIRPYGEQINGRVTVRDSNGASRTWDDYGVRFTGVRDGLDGPGFPGVRGRAQEVNGNNNPTNSSRLRTGGNISQIEDLVDRHLTFNEFHTKSAPTDYLNYKEQSQSADVNNAESPFYSLYARRLLSGLPMTPHETFAHPVACIIVISSRNPSPIEELRRLYGSTNSGDSRLPQWVNNEYLRYYVLVHDEDNDDVTKSTALYEQMKRHFGLHCHLLRLRSTQCVPSDDDSARLPTCEWMAAGEELSEIEKREASEDIDDPTPYVFESDASAIRTFVREMVTQSIIPMMERLSMTWNEQVASRRRGLTGRFTSISKRFNILGSARSSSTSASTTPSGSNYDSLQGFYRPETPEATMRKLGDYAFMLRDFKLAQATYDLLRTDFENDKAWKYLAGANEMTAITSLLLPQALNTKSKSRNIDQMLRDAHYSYLTRCAAPYYSLRTLTLGLELLKLRGSSAADEAAAWAREILENNLVGPIGSALYTERVAACFMGRKGAGAYHVGSRQRKAAFWSTLAADAWMRLDKNKEAQKSIARATALYGFPSKQDKRAFAGMVGFVGELQGELEGRMAALHGYDDVDNLMDEEEPPMEEESEKLDTGRSHRQSLIGGGPSPFGAVETGQLSPLLTTHEEPVARDDRFE